MPILPIALLIAAVVGLPTIYYLTRPRLNKDDWNYAINPTAAREPTKTEPEKYPWGPRGSQRPDGAPRRSGEVMASAAGLNLKSSDYRVLMQVLLSLVLVGASLLIILSQAYDPNSKHWAFGTIGTIVGFWLKGAR
jgi:hypothetical protein